MKSIQSNIKKAKQYLDKNHCIAVPTETVYGLAGNAYSDISVKKIFRLKKRPPNNPLIVHYSDINKLKIDCHINDNFIKLYNDNTFWSTNRLRNVYCYVSRANIIT